MFKDYFSKQATEYVKFRPRYPAELFSYLAALCKDHQLAWDSATGNGQAAVGIAPFFEGVVATDASQAQLDLAIADPKVKYILSPAEKTPLKSGSVDLITVASAVHWFDFDAFYAEAKRVLKPDGVIAVWVYNGSAAESEVSLIVREFVKTTVGSYFPEEVRRWVWADYKTIPFPFKEITAPEFILTVDWDLESLVGYLTSWSATQRYLQANGKNPLDLIYPKLKAALERAGGKIKYAWKIHLRVGTL